MVWPVSWIRRRLRIRRERRRQNQSHGKRARQNSIERPEIRVLRSGTRGRGRGGGPAHRCTVQVRARVRLNADLIYYILTSPENYKIFRNERSASERRVLLDDGVKQQVELSTSGHWTFLRFSGSFPVHLLVDQDSRKRSVVFRLLSTGFMRTFEGSWSVEPDTSPQINQNRENESSRAAGQGASRESSWVTLEQRVHLALMPPRPLDSLFYRIVGRVARLVLCDLQEEARRIHQGKPTIALPSSWNNAFRSDPDGVGAFVATFSKQLTRRMMKT
mmetsp:Transcript_14291/g.30788  ORF Transcript_14291/g.30788 Transcript_14291/m.30788 type:complete len:275 (-) Transcript_14291:1766-2590(-)